MKLKATIKTEKRLFGREMAVFILLVIASLLWLQFLQFPMIFDLRFNPYAILSFASIVANLAVLTIISRTRGYVEGLQWYVLFVIGAIIFGLSEFMLRLSATPNGAIFWSGVSTIGVTLVPISIYFFVASYIGDRKRNAILFSLFLACSGVIVYLSTYSNLIIDNDPTHLISFKWGFNNPTGSGYIIYVAWVGVLSFVALLRLNHFRRQATQQIIRAQSLLFMIAIGIPIVVGIVADGVLPAISYFVLPLSVVAETVTSILILYGLRRYRLFEINPDMLAANTLAAMDEAMIVTRKDFSIELTNLKAEKMLQVEKDGAAGKFLNEYFDSATWEKVIASDNKKQLDVEIVGVKGQRTPVRVSLSAMRETDEIEVYIFVLADITELAASYHNLQSKNQYINTQNQILTANKTELAKLLAESHSLQKQLANEKAGVEHTVAVRTKELVAAQKELQQADRLKTEFIMLTSHNLRTPLTVFLGGLELIKTTKLTPKQLDILSMIDNSGDRLKQFIDDMLTISQLEAGEQHTQHRETFTNILEPLLAESQSLADTKKLQFVADINTLNSAVNCSSLRLQGALRNVLNNAFKFTKSGSIQLSAKVESEHIIVRITDTGIGIKPQELPKLFSKFHRGTDAMQYDYEGEGIGLYLTKLIITDHHGKISVNSSLGKGTTVTIALPIVA